MKILYYFQQYSSPMYLWQNDHIVNELSHYDIQIEIFNPLKYESTDMANNELMQYISTNRVDLFMTCHADDLIYIDTIKRIKKRGIPTLLICFDNLLIPYEHKKICEYFDLVWLTSVENKDLFDKWGARTIFLPYAANPYFYKFINSDEIERICFIGTPYGSRANTINHLSHANIPITLYGKPLSTLSEKHVITKGLIYTVKTDLQFAVGRRLLLAALKQRLTKQAILDTSAPSIEYGGYANDMSIIYSKYALALSSTTARNTGILQKPVPVVNLRSFEIPMSGGIQFCKYNNELANYFQEEREIVFYKTEEEMLDKAKFYLDNERKEVRKIIRKNARKRAEAEHTWYRRFITIFLELGIKT